MDEISDVFEVKIKDHIMPHVSQFRFPILVSYNLMGALIRIPHIEFKLGS